MKIKVWFIHAACTFFIKETPANSFFSKFCRISTNTFLSEHSSGSASDFIYSTYINQTNTWKWIFYYSNRFFFQKKYKKAKKPSGSKTGISHICFAVKKPFCRTTSFFMLIKTWKNIWFKERFASCKQLLDIRKMSPLLPKNKFTSNI